ncbi:F-box/kelch-repeat protein At3g23880-like [Solanum verrucosum]|uniref:F-box/kelch-repeat protein At3g23880-like n=1 Tax=Solanum verrucosum TaxID=315347 RepID=UPI0020D13F39|nr:F-box/kelch-repeat protein At3g23880-like [Solanum verrucosum]
MFSFLTFRDWIHQVIHTVLLKFISGYDFVFTPLSTTTEIIIPNEILTDILLRLPPKSLLKCMSVSKSWHQLISSPDFVKTHLKLKTDQLVLFPGINGKYKFCSLTPLFNKQQIAQELLLIDSPNLKVFFVGSVNGLICLCNYARETYIWNPTLKKSKKVLYPKLGTSFYNKYGFGYDESSDDYKAVFVDYYRNSYNDDVSKMKTVISIYSLRTDSWTILHDELQGVFLLNHSGKFVNGKIYWAASTHIGNYDVYNIISFDVAEETWGSLELPSCGEVNSKFKFKLGVVGSDLSVMYTCYLGTATSDVWIWKDCSVSWMKLFTIEYPQNTVLVMFSALIFTFSIHLSQSEKGDILLSLPGLIMIFDGSTKILEHTADVEGCNPAETYAASIVNPLMISGKNSA